MAYTKRLSDLVEVASSSEIDDSADVIVSFEEDALRVPLSIVKEGLVKDASITWNDSDKKNIKIELTKADGTKTGQIIEIPVSEAEYNALKTSLTEEAERAKAAEQTNADAISSEVTRAKAAEKDNTDAIAEHSAEIATLQSEIDVAIYIDSDGYICLKE